MCRCGQAGNVGCVYVQHMPILQTGASMTCCERWHMARGPGHKCRGLRATPQHTHSCSRQAQQLSPRPTTGLAADRAPHLVDAAGIHAVAVEELRRLAGALCRAVLHPGLVGGGRKGRGRVVGRACMRGGCQQHRPKAKERRPGGGPDTYMRCVSPHNLATARTARPQVCMGPSAARSQGRGVAMQQGMCQRYLPAMHPSGR